MVAPTLLQRAGRPGRVQGLTSQLVRIKSGPSPYLEGENRVARFLVDRLKAMKGIEEARTLPMPDGREIAFGFLRKSDSPETLVLIGHTDTVGMDDFGSLKGLATEPLALRSPLVDFLRMNLNRGEFYREAYRDLQEDPNGRVWMVGRGSLDMKSGVAVEVDNVDVLSRDSKFKGNIIFLGTPDEENDSAGIFASIPYLRQFAADRRLNLLGVLNADYTARRFIGDESRYLYIGTIGKVLPSFYVVGKETHVGEVFNGLDANQINAEIVRLMSINPSLMDEAEGEVALPPVSLLSSDLRPGYNVQTTLEAWSYYNMFTHSRSVDECMQLMVALAKKAARNIKSRYQKSYDAYAQAAGLASKQSVNVAVYSYLDLVNRVGLDDVQVDIAKGEDGRIAARKIIQALWKKAGLSGPAIVTYLSPPFYPHSFISDAEVAGNPFVGAAKQMADDAGLVTRKFYPYISDGSYVRFRGGASDLGRFMPLWERGYSIPLDDMRALDLPVINLGPFGKDAHQLTERVHIPYSFGTLPNIMERVIRQTFANIGGR